MSLWSWFWQKCLMIFQYFLIKYKGFWFDYDAKHSLAKQTNRQTLFKILKQNRKTKFYIDQCEKCQFDHTEEIDTIEKFKKVFPNYTRYADYKPYITEILNDGSTKDIISVGYPIALTNTSGTSGEPKRFPVYSLDINEAYHIAYMATKTVRSNLFNNCKSISINSLKYETHVTKDKLKSYEVSAITGIAARAKQNVEAVLKFNEEIVPSIIVEQISQWNDLNLFILLWALQCRDLESISSCFVTSIIYFFTFLEKKFDFLCKHIELGTIPADESLSEALSIDVRLALQSPKYHRPPNPERAEELRQLVKEYGFDRVSTRFWPKLKCAICIISPSMRQFEQKLLATYWDPKVPIFPYVYGMSEHHRIAIPLNVNSYGLIPQPRSIFYEFIEVEDEDDEQSEQALELHQIEQNKCYEVIFTTYDGLYRYRTEDIIKVTGHYYNLPVWKLIGRRGQYLSVANEHVTETELRGVLDSVLSEYEKEFTSSSPQYSIFLEKSSYVLSIEVDEDKQTNEQQLKQVGQQICSKVDEQLQISNDDYRKGRKEKKISSPILLWLKYNTLTTDTKEFRLDPKKFGASGSKSEASNQLKSLVIMKKKNQKIIQFVKEHAVLKVN